MLKAYDTILQTEVSAKLAALSGGAEQYRYECACCGEEVFVAAPFSKKIASHFRHRSGNNDTECENYLGQHSALSTDFHSRKNNRERVEFYFEDTSKTFQLGIRFSEDEIQLYSDQNAELELSTNKTTAPCIKRRINRLNFVPESPTFITLNTFSLTYYLSNSVGGSKRQYDLFGRNNNPTFFKVLGNDGSSFKAKLVRSSALFTNTKYLVVWQNQYAIPRFPDEVNTETANRIETMNHRFLVMTLSITEKTMQIESLLQSWGYSLEASEQLTLLWPPAALSEESYSISSKSAFVYSSFTLKAHGNINLHSQAFHKVMDGVTEIEAESGSGVKIYDKNAEITLLRAEPIPSICEIIALEQTFTDTFVADAEDDCYQFSPSGVMRVARDQRIFLTPNSEIRQYSNGYLVKTANCLPRAQLSGEELLIDILAHSKYDVPLKMYIFDGMSPSDTALEYIMRCKETGTINAVAERLIMEGQL